MRLKRILPLLCCLLVMGLLGTGCGNRGDLYLPVDTSTHSTGE